jgi:lipid II:glycine glycyltransferase (peptidoglycan interpeptide bridge formation enzyme)
MWNDISEKEKNEFNNLATHPLQSFAWGQFREKTGVTVIRKGLFDGKKLLQALQLTIHKIPHTSFTIGYLPKGRMPTKEALEELKKIGKEYNCVFIQLEPNVKNSSLAKMDVKQLGLVASAHPLFTKYTFQLDLTKSEEELLKQMHPKTRYNIKVAEKHKVSVQEEISDNAFAEYWKLTQETTQRQGFYAHTPSYHKKMWETLGTKTLSQNELTAHLLIARFNGQPLTAWILFVFKDTLYYPYGASSNEHRETMASNLQMWEAIKFGKKHQLKMFDMWGSLGETPNTKDPWFGFHRFKQGYGPTLVEFVGSFDLVINPAFYQIYKIIDKLRWIFLRIKK